MPTYNSFEIPESITTQAHDIAKDALEDLIGYSVQRAKDADPNGLHRVTYWVIHTDKGLYYIDADSELCVRATSVHAF